MNVKVCEYCGSVHDGSYASGRFCSQKCARGASTRGTKDKTKISNCIQCYKQIQINIRSRKTYCQTCKEKHINRPKTHLVEGVCVFCHNSFIRQVRYSCKNTNFCSPSCQSKYTGRISWDINHRSYTMSKIDQSWQKGVRPCRGGRCKRYKYKDTLVQGTYQLRTCYILDKFLELGKIKSWIYTNDRIKYKWQDGTEHYYFPDFKIIENNDTQYYLEIKGFTKHIDKLKWDQTIQQGYKLQVWFETDIIQNEKYL